MDLLKEAIQEKRKLVETIDTLAKKEIGENKKYLKRGEKERVLEKIFSKEDEDKKQEQKENESKQPDQPVFKKRKLEDDESDKKEIILPEQEVIRRLRIMGEPILLFGESIEERRNRFKKLEEERGIGRDDDIKNNETRNVFLESDRKEDNNNKEKEKEIPPFILPPSPADLVPEPSDPSIHESNAEVITKFFRELIKLWALELANRPESEKYTPAGQTARKTVKQCRDYLKPLFKQLKDGTLPKDLENGLFNIVRLLKQKEYIKANDAYIGITIGNAPWPMGVSAVGIHNRSARDKIEDGKIAHVLNNEQNRKFLTNVKRLMTYCQNKWPLDPSKMWTT